MQFAGAVVEIQGLPGPLQPVKEDGSDAGATAVDANGLHGRALWDEQRNQYVVHLQNDLFIPVAEGNLRLWDPPAYEQGGCDLLWPSTQEMFATFAFDVAMLLAQRGWCLIEGIVGDQVRAGAVAEAEGLQGWYGVKREFVPDYLGRGGSGKVVELPFSTAALQDAGAKQPSDDQGANPHDALDRYEKCMADLAAELMPLAPDVMGFDCAGRRATMAWMPFAGRQETLELRGAPLSEEDVESGLLEGHLTFIRQRRVGLLWMVENSGGELVIVPRPDFADLEQVRLPARPNRLLVYRTDWMSFAYKPKPTATSLVLQTWLLEELPRLTMKNLVGDDLARSRAQGIVHGIPQPFGNRIHILSLAARTAGSIRHFSASTLAYVSGLDAFVEIPSTRFDVNLYCTADTHSSELGKSYCRHSGIFDNEHFVSFDDRFFGIMPQEVKLMSPAQRLVMEEGYTALHNAGHTKQSLKNRPVGVYVGDTGSEWSPMQAYEAGDLVPCFVSSCSQAITSARLSHCLSLRGPTSAIDTACSASLVAMQVSANNLRQTLREKQQKHTRVDSHLTEALNMGVSIQPGPIAFVALAGGGMLSHDGRCFTFNESADGYARGEGCCGVFLRISDRDEDVIDQMACLLGVAANQDGRSANLTAPNGPAQQACIVASMREAGCTAKQVVVAECHGTGTSLGDPIECGALRRVMEPRDTPLFAVSAKSHVGHLEACAGVKGVIKCIAMCNMSLATADPHLCTLNSNIDWTGFPAWFPNEISDTRLDANLAGVSSFGFGGTNARADLWSQKTVGHRSTGGITVPNLSMVQVTCPVTLGPIDYLTGEPLKSVLALGGDKHRADVLRDPLAPYDISRYVYSGGFRYRLSNPMDEYDEDVPAGCRLCISGSWSAWKKWQVMESRGSGIYGMYVVLGESRCERFYLSLDGHGDYEAIYPVARNAQEHVHILGPDDRREGRSWCIDGRDEEVAEGTIYLIQFKYGVLNKQVRWEPVKLDPDELLHVRQYPHTYFLAATFTSWLFQEMTAVDGEEGMWEVTGRIGPRGQEQFKFLRDRDWDQAIYPARLTSKMGVPVRGPGDMGSGKAWAVFGEPGELLRMRLQVQDARVTVELHRELGPPLVWEGVEGWDRHQYYTLGSWSSWEPTPMVMSSPGVFRCRVQPFIEADWAVIAAAEAEFRIAVDADPDQVFYPIEGGLASSFPGKQIVQGPDGDSRGRAWTIVSKDPSRSWLEISLDLTSMDRRRVVAWRWLDAASSR